MGLMTKPILNKLKVCSYDKRWGPHNRLVDWVTESEYTSEKSLTVEEFNRIVSQHHTISGELRYRKIKLVYGDHSVYYKHILEEIMY